MQARLGQHVIGRRAIHLRHFTIQSREALELDEVNACFNDVLVFGFPSILVNSLEHLPGLVFFYDPSPPTRHAATRSAGAANATCRLPINRRR
jgi:hypothetical protein